MTILSKSENVGAAAANGNNGNNAASSVSAVSDAVVAVDASRDVDADNNRADNADQLQVGWSPSSNAAVSSVVGEKRSSSSAGNASCNAGGASDSANDCDAVEGARTKKRRRVAGGKRASRTPSLRALNNAAMVAKSTMNNVANAPMANAPMATAPLSSVPLNSSTLGSVEPEVEERSGCNSEDEYVDSQMVLSENEWRERDRAFELMLRKKGFLIKRVEEDGSCLFRAVADQVYGDQEMHDHVRGQCMNYIIGNRDYFSEYLTEDIADYVRRKRYLGVHGNHLEVQALSEMYNRPIHIYSYASEEPINIFQLDDNQPSTNAPIRLSYQRGVHYNSIIDPHHATVGVGLGLPGHSPGSADRSLMSKACEASEQDLVEKTMLEDKIKATDWEATNEAIEEQVARESYLQWLRDNERRSKGSFNRQQQQQQQPVATVTSGAACRVTNESEQCWNDQDEERGSVSVANRFLAKVSPPSAGCSTDRDSPKPCSSHQRSPSARDRENGGFPTNDQARETAEFLNELPPDMFGLDDWGDADVLTRVLAASQQEYLNSLKKQQQQNSK